jgi:hypothetical protein
MEGHKKDSGMIVELRSDIAPEPTLEPSLLSLAIAQQQILSFFRLNRRAAGDRAVN